MSDLVRDPARLAALARTQLMDSSPEEVFDRLTRLASKLLGAPVALMSLVDGNRQYFKSAVGVGVTETPLSHSFCQHIVTHNAPLVVSDARGDPRLQGNPAIAELGVVAYCGVPLTDADGYALGAFCAIENGPREWSDDDVEILTELAYGVMTELELRSVNLALSVRERETRSIIDGAHDAFVATNSDGLIFDWNPAAERLFGWRAADVIGRLESETILPQATADGERRHGLARFVRTRATDVPELPVEVAARHRSGRELLVELTVARVDSPEGTRFNALIRDIGERRSAERRHAQLAQVVESTLDAVTSVDRDGTITSWNRGAELLYGFTAQEIVGRTQPHRHEPGGRPDETAELLPRLLAGEHMTVRALPQRRKDGGLIYVDVSAAPLRDENGEIIGATSITRDVTEQHRLERELAESEIRFRETFDEAPIGIALVGPNGRWLEVNRALCEIVGYSEAELLELSFQDMTHPDDVAADVDLLRRVLAGEVQTSQMEKRYFHKHGRTIWVKLSVAVVCDEVGTPLHLVSHVEDITRSKATESALREGRRLLDESQAVAGVGSWAWNLETGEPSWSVQQFLLHGLNPISEIPTLEQFADLVHPSDRNRLATSIAAHVTAQRAFADEYRITLPRSGVRTLSVRGDFLAGDPTSGLPPRMAGTTQDVTAERAAQVARQEIENRQSIVLSSLPDTMIMVYDRDLRCSLLQGAMLEQLGLNPAQFDGRLLSEMLAPEPLKALEPFITQALTGEHASTEFPSSDGRTYHVDIAPYRSEAGAITGAFTVWRDITDRLERDRQTRQLATIVEQSEDAIIAKSSDGIITDWNQGAELLYGYAAADVVGQSISLLVPPERHGEDRELLGRALNREAVPQFETTRIREDGSRVEVSISVSPLYGADESVIGASVIARDMTERKQMEDNLRASREQALEASRLKSEFVANMSHEIRTPLNGVVSMAELLLDTPLNTEQGEYAQVALTSAEALMRVINDILDFSKIEAGKLEIVAEDFSVRAAVNEVGEILGFTALERGLDVDVSIDPEVAEVVRGDGSRVRQVLMNLLSNAIKFTTEGEVRITVGVEEAGGGGDECARFEVIDTGIGIPADRLDALFEPFSQADATTTRRYGGTGLGLCISKQLVELMGGAIGCESEPGKGSRFWFTIPYEPSAGFEADLLGTDLTGTRVLIVDPVADERQMLESCLASWGISPASAPDAEAALTLLRRAAETGRPYETALIERDLPGTDGLELARAIKAVPALRSTRLILIGDAQVDPDDAQAAGIDAQLFKPVRASRLYNQLVATVRRPGGAPPAIARADPRDGSVAGGWPPVLVAEDNEVNQFAAIRLLRRFGFSVDLAVNGREAIGMSGRKEYAAIFMDCQMPEVDGYTATRVIRRREAGGLRTPIVALTAHALEGDREKCLESGMDDYLTKPLRLQTLEALIQRIPQLRPQRHPTTPSGEPGAVFDPAALNDLGDPETGAEIAAMFLDQASERLPALLEAIEAGDAETVRGLAHGLKGSAATVGATRMSELSGVLSKLAAGGLTPAAADIHSQLADAAHTTSTEMHGYIAQMAC
jgi:two-component system sensor histidine kinase/response regulator